MTESNVSADRDRLIHILVVHYDMFRDKAEEAADLFLHDKVLAAAKVRAIREGDGEVGAGWEKHSLEEKQRVQKNSGIPHLPTDMTYEARLAMAGEGPRGYEWSDKKHRLVYDLCREIERIAALAASPAATGGEKE